MERIVYLLGTSHACQGGYEIKNEEAVSKNDLIEFSKFLCETCRAYGIKAICEEMHPENLDDKHKGISIPMHVASFLENVKHKYCDPSQEQKKVLGIRESGSFTQTKKLPKILQPEDLKNLTQEEADELEWQEDLKREPYWLCQIQDLNTWPTIFICGSSHVPTFSNLLKTATFTVHTVDEKWEPTNKQQPCPRSPSKR